MGRILKVGLGAFLAALFIVCGCGPNSQTVLSPDGKTIAVVNRQGLLLHDVEGKQSDLRLNLDRNTLPAFSPDGKWILGEANVPAPAVRHRKSGPVEIFESSGSAKTVVLDRQSGHQIELPDISAPFAWNPDCSEIVGMRNHVATIVHIRSRSVVRSYPLPEDVTTAIWLTSRDIAFSNSKRIYVLHAGVVRSHAAGGKLETLQADLIHQALYWVETVELKSKKKWPVIQTQVKRIGYDFKDETVVLSNSYLDKFLQTNNKSLGLIDFSLSPDGDRFLASQFLDENPPGVFQKYVVLGGLDWNQNRSPQLEKRLEEFQKQMRFRLSYIVGPLHEDPRVLPKEVLRSGKFSLLDKVESSVSEISQDGKSVAYFDGKNPYLIHLP